MIERILVIWLLLTMSFSGRGQPPLAPIAAQIKIIAADTGAFDVVYTDVFEGPMFKRFYSVRQSEQYYSHGRMDSILHKRWDSGAKQQIYYSENGRIDSLIDVSNYVFAYSFFWNNDTACDYFMTSTLLRNNETISRQGVILYSEDGWKSESWGKDGWVKQRMERSIVPTESLGGVSNQERVYHISSLDTTEMIWYEINNSSERRITKEFHYYDGGYISTTTTTFLNDSSSTTEEYIHRRKMWQALTVKVPPNEFFGDRRQLYKKIRKVYKPNLRTTVYVECQLTRRELSLYE